MYVYVTWPWNDHRGQKESDPTSTIWLLGFNMGPIKEEPVLLTTETPSSSVGLTVS